MESCAQGILQRYNNASRVPVTSHEIDAIYQRLVDHDQYQLGTNFAEERHEHKQLKEAAYSGSGLSLTETNSSPSSQFPPALPPAPPRDHATLLT
ncbi:hypothetical protein LTR15_006668 [Elasticomyces elasticus]|nr:hypothetical protein LTR15_006668 [Elasticomyces elasticus]